MIEPVSTWYPARDAAHPDGATMVDDGERRDIALVVAASAAAFGVAIVAVWLGLLLPWPAAVVAGAADPTCFPAAPC